LSACRKYLGEVAAPAGGIFAGPVASNGGPVEDGFNPPSDAVRGLGLILPDRLDAAEHKAGIDISDRKLTDFREGIGLEGRKKLGSVLVVPPLALM